MTTWLLTWNPKKWTDWTSLPAEAKKTRSGVAVRGTWSCGNTISICPGDRVFLMKQGPAPRGVLASGWAKAFPEQGPHWSGDQAKNALYVECEFDRILDPDAEDPLPVSLLMQGALAGVNWSTQKSGIRVRDVAAQALEKLWGKHIGHPPPRKRQIELDDEVEGFEGEQRPRFLLHRHREQRLRNAKIEQVLAATGRLRCEVPGCKFDFFEVYGPIGQGFAHVHHRQPLSTRDAVSSTKLKDLAVVCANCHAMIHRGGKCRSLKGLLRNRKTSE